MPLTRDEWIGAVETLLVDASSESREVWRSLLTDARLGAAEER